MNKHTAGQWYTGNSVFGDFGVFTDADVHPNMICSVKKSVEDARLIAASPSLYKYVFDQAENGDMTAIELIKKFNLG